ncbi:hypothetical protein KIL84_000884 [Mauremys mutica]|uniref:ADF-H domain-containing protein n=1 Tax=Mauremys mutica TaxID=74926 RepID=A0A9D3WTH4_9SAUR|nr:hypothetical protein KIL84_000884 [Mauremys mutica]
MIYASSKDAIKKKLTGIKHELQATCYEEVKDRCTLAQKLGGNAVVSLEGKPFTHLSFPKRTSEGELEGKINSPFLYLGKLLYKASRRQKFEHEQRERPFLEINIDAF